MKYCRNCNLKTNDYVKFCNVCGEKLTNIKEKNISHQEVKEIRASTNSNELIPNKKTKGKNNKALLIIPLVAILTLAVIGILFYKPILSSYYIYKGENSQGNERINYYISAMKYSDDKKILENIYILLNDEDFEDNIQKLSSSLDNKTYKNLSVRYYLDKVDTSYIRGEYKEAYLYLDRLGNLGYNKLSYPNYDKIEKSIKTSKGSLPTEQYKDFNDMVKGDYLIEDSSIRLLSKSELARLSLAELALVRNEIFARHGYAFVQEPYKSYFKTKSWYKVNTSFKGSYDELNYIEKSNVELIKEVEGLN